MNEYDIGKAFERIENELIRSMIRNLDRHRAEETELGYNWEQWQVKQLQALEEYKKANRKQFKGRFRRINASIDGLISLARQEGNMSQEKAILEAIKKGYRPRTFKDLFEKYKGKNIREIMDLILRKNIQSEINGEFFKLNDRKMTALIRATKRDFQKAEHAILRMAEDQYRKIIFDAQVYANTGSATYEKAVDMATKDFLSRGINCIEYSNGARHTVADYAYMAIQTACKRAYLTGEGEKRKEWGIPTVIMNKRGNPCPKCLPFVGKVLIDDVWSGGSAKDGKYPLMSQAIARGLYHPRCKDSHTTYFEGISTPADERFTQKEINKIEKNIKNEARKQYINRQIEKYSRLEENSLDKENKEKYGVRKNQWQNVRFRTGGIDNKEYMMTKRPLAKFKAVSQEKVVNLLRQESEEWLSILTNEEKRAIIKYTYNSGDKKPNRFFERLNAMLRGDLAEDKKLREYADIISSALKKNKLKHDVICYRNVSVNPIGEKAPESIVKFNQFTSTSVVEKRALDSKYKIIIYAPKGTVGAYIEKISKFPKQRELLLDKDCIYRVISNKGNKIELEVIP